MTRTEKGLLIQELRDKFENASYFYVTDASELTVDKINKLSGAFKNLSGQQQAAVAQEMFGQEAFTGMLTILNSNETETAALTKALSDYNGAAAKAADINNSGLSGSLDGLSGAFQELKITIGEQFTPVFQPMIDVITTATA